MEHILQALLTHKIVAILRGIEHRYADDTAEALTSGGIRLMEITMNTDGAAAMIERWSGKYGAKAYVGAGTVIDLETARLAVAAGASFLISPNVDEEVIAYGHERGIPVWPGAMTPTEIVRAWKAGAGAVKLFPMASLGTAYLKEIRGPLEQIPILATGGVDSRNIADYFKAGASAVGMGSKLLNPQWIREGNVQLAAEHVKKLVDAAAGLSQDGAG